jgi:hypothetical protein
VSAGCRVAPVACRQCQKCNFPSPTEDAANRLTKVIAPDVLDHRHQWRMVFGQPGEVIDAAAGVLLAAALEMGKFSSSPTPQSPSAAAKLAIAPPCNSC